jgi:hypothetical protein
VSRQKRRRPLDKKMDIPVKVELKIKNLYENSQKSDPTVTKDLNETDDVDGAKISNGKSKEDTKLQNSINTNNDQDHSSKSAEKDKFEECNTFENATMVSKIEQTVRKFSSIKRLDKILKRLSERMHEKLLLSNNSIPQNSTQVLNYSVSNNVSNMSHYHHHYHTHHHHQQHVSPRKRILREFEKVSLEDQVMKRSRPKPSLHNNGNTIVTATISSPIPLTKITNRKSNSKTIETTIASLNSTSDLNSNLKNNNCDNNANSTIKAHNNKPVRRPFSSYSITSLLGHNSEESNNHNNGNNYNNNVNKSSNEIVSSTSHQQHFHYQHTQANKKNGKESEVAHSQRLSLNSPQLLHEFAPSSTLLQAHNQSNYNNNCSSSSNNKRKSPVSASTTPPYSSTTIDIVNSTSSTTTQSPNVSPSPEHHAFQKYRPQHVTPTPPSSSPYSFYQTSLSLVSSPNYVRRTPSPKDSSLTKNRIRTKYNCDSAASALADQPSQTSKRNYSNSSHGHSPSLHYSQATLSPFSGHNNSIRRSPSNFHENDNSQCTELNIRKIPKNICSQPFENDISTKNLLNEDKSMKAKNERAEFDNQSLIRPSALIAPPPPIPLHYYMYSPHTGYVQNPFYSSLYNPSIAAAAAVAYNRSPVFMQLPHTSSASSSNSTSISINRNSSISSQQIMSETTYIPTSPWNPIPLTVHRIDDGNLIDKIKDETNSGMYEFYTQLE